MFIGHTNAKYALISNLTRPGCPDPDANKLNAYIYIWARKLKFETHIKLENIFFSIEILQSYTTNG